MPADLIIYMIIAAGLIIWLRNILGTRSGDERQRPNPYLQSEKPKESKDGKEYPYEGVEKVISAEDRIIQLAQQPNRNMAVDNKTAENGLLEISKQDKKFDIQQFLTGAQDAFVMIVEAFADGDRETLKGLLADPVYKAFDGAIREREAAGEKIQAEIQAIRKADVIDALVKDKTAFITVRFTADETRIVRDSDGEIISGDPQKTTKMRDVWTFGRKIAAKDPRWLVYETREDAEDNDLMPNAGQI